MKIAIDFGGGIGYVEMLYRSNILAFVSGGTNPQKGLDHVWIWDDNQNKMLADINFKGQEVKSVKLRPNRYLYISVRFGILKKDSRGIGAQDLCLQFCRS